MRLLLVRVPFLPGRQLHRVLVGEADWKDMGSQLTSLATHQSSKKELSKKDALCHLRG